MTSVSHSPWHRLAAALLGLRFAPIAAARRRRLQVGQRLAGCRWLATLVSCICAALPVKAGATDRKEIERVFRQALQDFDQAQQIQRDQPDRARRLFDSARQRFAGVAGAGVVNGRLEYNLGNCYLQMDDIGRAMVHYRRAERLIPRDPLLADNIKEAQSRCLTPIQPARRSALLQSVFFWHFQTSFAGRCTFALVMYIAFWLLLAFRSVSHKRSATVGAVMAGVLALIAAGSVAYERWSIRSAAPGVITSMDVVVYKGPGAGYQRQFEQPLQPGVEFVLKEPRGDWWNIELLDGNSGWIRKETAVLVTSGDAPSG